MKTTRRVASWLLGIVVALTLGGALYQWLATQRDVKRFPMPGERVAIGGRSLHLYCSGDGPVTVLLENGLGGNYSAWRLVQASIAAFARVCSYDRAGLGWSDAPNRATRAQFVAEDLDRLVHAAGLQPPFVLVGWSAGGVYVRRYYHEHPDGVIGMVWVDSSHEQQGRRLAVPGDSAQTKRDAMTQLLACRALAWTGLVRAIDVMDKLAEQQQVPGTLRDELVAMENRSNYCAGVAAEMRGFDLDIVQTNPPDPIGDLPLVVVTHGRAASAHDFAGPVSQTELAAAERSWIMLQNELAALSTDTSQRVASLSGHAIPLQAPEAVVDAVRDIIDNRF